MAEKQQRQYIWKTDRFFGGQSEDSRVGSGPGAFRNGSGLDYQQDSGLLQIANLPVADDGGVLDQAPRWFEIRPSNGDVWMYGTTKIYKEVSGTYSAVRTLSGDSPNGQGLCEFNGALYYATDTQLGRTTDYSAFTDNYQTGLTSSPWHPMCRFRNALLIGHGRYIATLEDDTTWTLAALTLPPGYNVRSIFPAGAFVVILATRGSTISASDQGMMFLWNGFADTYNSFIPLNGNPHAGIALNNELIILSGIQPSIQKSLGGVAQIMQNLPNVGVGKTAEVWPGAIDIWNNQVYFGISDGTSTTVNRMVHSFGAKNARFPQSLNPIFPTSVGNLTGTGVQITAVKKIGTTLRFAWIDGSDEGVDEIDLTQYQTNGIFRSLAYDHDSPYEKIPSKFMVELAGGLAEGEVITGKVSGDPYGDPTFASAPVSGSQSTDGEKILEIPMKVNTSPVRSRDLQFEVTLTGDNSSTPKVKRIWMEFEEADDQL